MASPSPSPKARKPKPTAEEIAEIAAENAAAAKNMDDFNRAAADGAEVPHLAESSRAAQENNKAAQEMAKAHATAVQDAKDKRKVDNAAVAAGNAAATSIATA